MQQMLTNVNTITRLTSGLGTCHGPPKANTSIHLSCTQTYANTYAHTRHRQGPRRHAGAHGCCSCCCCDYRYLQGLRGHAGQAPPTEAVDCASMFPGSMTFMATLLTRHMHARDLLVLVLAYFSASSRPWPFAAFGSKQHQNPARRTPEAPVYNQMHGERKRDNETLPTLRPPKRTRVLVRAPGTPATDRAHPKQGGRGLRCP